MATADTKKQKLFIQDLLSSPEIYNRTASIVKPSYFDPQYERAISYIHEYYGKYSATPDIDQVNAEHDLDFEVTVRVTKDRIQSTCDEIEYFCRVTAVKEAIFATIDDIANDDMSKVMVRLGDAFNISLQKDMGLDIFENPEDRLQSLIEDFTPVPTGIEGIDGPLGGGIIRKQFTLFSANSGGGKSIMMANIGANFALAGYDVVYLSLELPAEMVFLRLASMISGVGTANWKAHIPEIGAGMTAAMNQKGDGSYIVKRLPQHSTSADIRSYLSFYEMEYEKTPDIILVDYLDLMDPNGGAGNMGVFDQDKRKSEELVEILHDYDMFGISASQQNRDALNMNTPSQAGIAGGISKVNTVDNYISLFMDETMRLANEMNAYFLKTRSSSGVGQMSSLRFDSDNLRITDPDGGGQTGIMPRKRKNVPSIEEKMEDINTPNDNEVTADIGGDLPGLEGEPQVNEPPTTLFDDDDLPPIMPKLRTDDGGESLMSLMTSLNGD